MKHEIAEKWIAALRSGEYQQGRERLRKGDEFCCLGVLCDLHRKEMIDHSNNVFNKNLKWHLLNTEEGIYGYGTGNLTFTLEGMPPLVVHEWAGIRKHGEGVTDLHELALMNDGQDNHPVYKKHTFAQIADWIEQHWEEL